MIDMSSIGQPTRGLRRPLHLHFCRGAWLWQLAGCLDTNSSVTGGRPEFAVSTHDFMEVPVAAGRLPQWPKLKLTGVLSPPPEGLALLPGKLTPALLTDLEHPPLNQDRAAEQIPLRLLADGAATWLVPRQPLSRGRRYVLALPADEGARAALGEEAPLAIELAVDPTPSAGARLLASAPADGESDVPVALRQLLLAFDGPLAACAGFRLGSDPTLYLPGTAHAGAAALEIQATALPCTEVDERAHACCRLRLESPLEAGRRYTLDPSAVRDLHGAPPTHASLTFATAAAIADTPPPPPLLASNPCEDEELELSPGVCLLVADRFMLVRLSTATPARVLVELEGRGVRRLAGVETVEIELSELQPGRDYDLALTLADLRGGDLRLHLSVTTTPPLPALNISEVCGDPIGLEPQQEYVELHNFGTTALDVGGFSLGSDLSAADRLPSRVLPGDTRLLVVSPGYDPSAPGEPRPPPGAQRTVLPRPLGRNGLSNRGEALKLWTPSGHLVSQSPAIRVGSGLCLQRQPEPCPGRRPGGDFVAGPCTPGR